MPQYPSKVSGSGNFYGTQSTQAPRIIDRARNAAVNSVTPAQKSRARVEGFNTDMAGIQRSEFQNKTITPEKMATTARKEMKADIQKRGLKK